MKHYTYVSDAKVDMLFAQIPPKLSQRISAELKINVKVISLTLRPDSEPATRYAKAGVVDEYLHRHEPPGTVSAPSRHFAATMALRWTVVGDTAVWCGRHGSTLVGLTGSKHHLTGGGPPSAELGSLSLDAMRRVARELALLGGEDESGPDAFAGPASALSFVARSLRGPEQPMEFVAVNHGTESVDDAGTGVYHVLLGSPIYVAMA